MPPMGRRADVAAGVNRRAGLALRQPCVGASSFCARPPTIPLRFTVYAFGCLSSRHLMLSDLVAPSIYAIIFAIWPTLANGPNMILDR